MSPLLIAIALIAAVQTTAVVLVLDSAQLITNADAVGIANTVAAPLATSVVTVAKGLTDVIEAGSHSAIPVL